MAWYDLFVGKRGNITDNSSQSDTIEDLLMVFVVIIV